MAVGNTLGLSQALSEYRAMASGKGIGEAWNALLEVNKSNSNILSELMGPVGSKKPFTVKNDLTAGRNDRVNMNVAASLGMAARMGSEVLTGYNEVPIHGNWQIRLDQKRIAVGWSEFVAAMANTGGSFKEVYADLLGTRFGQIEQEDALHRFLKDATAGITLRPNSKASNAALRVADNFDVDTLKRAVGKLKSLGAEPASIGKTTSGRPIQKYIAFGADAFVRGIKDETAYTAPAHAALGATGESGGFFMGDYLPVDGHLVKPWDLVDHDNPGPIGSAILPKALLGDASATAGGAVAGAIASGTVAFDIYGGGRTQTSLGDQATLYKPFVDFPGYAFKHYEEESISADSTEYFIVVYDPDDGKWNLYGYTGSGNNGHKIAITKRLHSSTTGAAYTTIKTDGFGGAGSTTWTYDTAYNKLAFGPGCVVFPVNAYLVPYGYGFVWGADAGGYAYGKFKNQRIMEKHDFDDRVAFGIKSIYGTGVRLDTLSKPRGFVKIEAAVVHEGISLPTVT